MTSDHIYWSRFIVGLRRGLKLNQVEMASVLGVDQASISRWERGVALPSLGIQSRISEMAKQQGISTIDNPMNVVKFNPFPVCLVDRHGMVVEVSEGSLFSEGKTITEQVYEDERNGVAFFIQRLDSEGFWVLRCARVEQKLKLLGVERKVVAIPILLSGELFCLFHKKT